MYEYGATIPTLWENVKSKYTMYFSTHRTELPNLNILSEFVKEHPQYIAEDNSMKYMSDNGGDTYNLCHFWSNFEIASMDFWRGEAYSQFFDYLDSTGGFYYEVRLVQSTFMFASIHSFTDRHWIQRWGDAPVHSMGVALFARKDQIHFFDNIGYEHAPYTHCPRGEGAWERGKCACNPSSSFGELLVFQFKRAYISRLTRYSIIDYDGYSCMKQWDRIH